MNILEKVARALHAQTAKNLGKFPVPSYEHDTAGFYAGMATAAITAFLEAAAEPDKHGRTWHMRPDEATEEMINVEGGYYDAKSIYHDMLAAAPEFEWKNDS